MVLWKARQVVLRAQAQRDRRPPPCSASSGSNRSAGFWGFCCFFHWNTFVGIWRQMKKHQLILIIEASTYGTPGTDQAWRNFKWISSRRRRCIRQSYLEFQYLVAQCPNSLTPNLLFLGESLPYSPYPADSTEALLSFHAGCFTAEVKKSYSQKSSFKQILTAHCSSDIEGFFGAWKAVFFRKGSKPEY